jgi:hypothetical protein
MKRRLRTNSLHSTPRWRCRAVSDSIGESRVSFWVMWLRRRLPVSVLLACILGGVAVVFWPHRCPVQLKLVSVDRDGMVDDTGADLWLVGLSVSNRYNLPLAFFKSGTKGQARVANAWVDAACVQLPDGVGPGRPAGRVFLLVPRGASACRLRVNFAYAHESLRHALGIGLMEPPSRGALRCQQVVRWASPWLFGRIWRANASPTFFTPSWHRTVITPELLLEPSPGRATNAFDGADDPRRPPDAAGPFRLHFECHRGGAGEAGCWTL